MACELQARVPTAGLDDLLSLMAEQPGGDRSALWADFAASSLHAATSEDACLTVRVDRPGASAHFADAHVVRMSRLEPRT